MAKRLGKPRSTYASWEDNIEPSWNDLNEIAKICNIKVADLIEEKSDLVGKVKNVANEGEAAYATKDDYIKHLEQRLLTIETAIQDMAASLRTVHQNQVVMAAMSQAGIDALLTDQALQRNLKPETLIRSVRNKAASVLRIFQRKGIAVGADI